jgi:hypothetical protein
MTGEMGAIQAKGCFSRILPTDRLTKDARSPENIFCIVYPEASIGLNSREFPELLPCFNYTTLSGKGNTQGADT